MLSMSKHSLLFFSTMVDIAAIPHAYSTSTFFMRARTGAGVPRID